MLAKHCTQMHMVSRKKRLVVELLPAHINQLKWVAMKRRVSVTDLIGEWSCQLFVDEVPAHFDLQKALSLISESDDISKIPFD